jgi:predicted TIM-barrel fold metal-dependent hydrolase
MKVPYPGAIDCDLHLPLPQTRALLPYLNDFWREQLTTRYIDKLNFQLSSYAANSPLSMREDWRRKPDASESDLDLLRRQALDPFGTRIAICSMLHGAIALFNEDMGAAICSAVNDYVAAEWLDKEPRLRGSILVTGQNADHAVAEIERLASDQRFVQVLLPVMADFMPGQRLMWPIYKAAEKHGLAIGLHAGSTYRFAPTGSGWPSYQVEDYISHSTAFENAIVSFLAEGVFNVFPNLRLVCLESSFTFLPTLMWRVNKEWRGVRQEVPWIDRPPADIVRERIRFTLHPVDAPNDPAILNRVLEHIGSDEMILFSTDYPHAHFEGDNALPDGLPDALIRKILIDNPLKAYPRLAGAKAKESVS